MENVSKIQNPPMIYKREKSLDQILFPVINPFKEDHLIVSDIHKIWYAKYGNPKGVPVLVVHGGPGFGCSPRDMRFFDPNFYRIILFDQRGAPKSIPLGEVKENNTHDLINDIEKLRNYLGVDKWLVFGGSWGSALSLLYGENHPERCLGFVLRGVFLSTEAEFKQVWYGMRDHYPEVWEEYISILSENERNDIITAFQKRLWDPNPAVHMQAAQAFMKYDVICAHAMEKPPLDILNKEDTTLACVRIFTHYCVNNFFIKEDQIINNLDKITSLPAIIVHGRFDVITRPPAAYNLHKKWPNSELIFVQDAGHSTAEPAIAKSLVNATEKMKVLIEKNKIIL